MTWVPKGRLTGLLQALTLDIGTQLITDTTDMNTELIMYKDMVKCRVFSHFSGNGADKITTIEHIFIG